ncbi:SGNH/GDSL hydrolase family protein [Candidatus Curtissbacteria bacterium]|nr:SGNH/GDSL hydrolase family protein [Candidatus Curtissbacteria bacterium]
MGTIKTKFIVVSVIILILEIILLSLIWISISRKIKVLGNKVEIPLARESFTLNPTDNLQYFYEPKAYQKKGFGEDAPWLTEKPEYNINSEGIRGLEYSQEKLPETFRIMTLGDSFTFGLFVNTPSNYPSQLEQLLNQNCHDNRQFEVINLGVPGYDIRYAAESFVRKKTYNPDLILWLLQANDFYTPNELFRPKRNSYFNQIEQNKSDNLTSFQIWREAKDKALEELNNIFGQEKFIQYETDSLYEFNKYYSGNLLVFTFPGTPNEYKSIMKKFVSSRAGIFYFDEVRNIYNLGLKFPDGHPTTEGYKIIAEDLFNYLTTNKIIPCN